MKPPLIVITVARKPLGGTVASNAQKYGTGGINIDASRIPAGKDYTESDFGPRFFPGSMAYMGSFQTRPWVQKAIAEGRPVKDSKPNQAGRWPTNVILEHKLGCKCIGESYGVRTVPAWECEPGCPVAEMDRQSGDLHSQDPATRNSTSPRSGIIGFADSGVHYGDAGGASRFFKQVQSHEIEFTKT